MTSIYAASSIHSKSTLSKKYEVDMSAMWNGGEKLRVKADESHDQFSFSYYLQQYSMDVGRFIALTSWLNTLRMIVFPFYLILDSTGVLLTNDFSSQFFNTIITILKRCIVILPLNASINTLVTFNFSLIIIYAALMYLLFKNILKYRSGNVPSRSDIYSWILNSRILCPILSSYISYYFSKYLFAIVGEYTMNELYNLMISIPIIIMHSTYVFYSCAIYNATPLIRPNDITQLWYAHSCLDRRINMVLYVLMFFQSLLTFFSSPIKEIAHFVFIFALASFFAFNVLRILPAVAPKYNAVIIWAALASLPLTLFPLVSYYTEKYALYYFIGCIIFIPIAYFIAKKLVTIRCRRIIDAFTGMRESEDEEGEDNNLDPLSAAILHLNQNTNVDFLKLNISGEHQISLYLRVGFLFHIPEVEDQSFIKWSIDQTVKADLLLSACQISYALKNDFRMLNSLSVHVDKLSSGPFNSRSFALLFDLLRQESLTQLNQPLLSNIQHCKHESYTLQNFCSEFWGNVIKQRIQCMNDVIPQISNEFTRTENLFQNLIRNYPLSSTAYRETVIIYHKVLGNHEKTLELQAKLNKIKKIGDVESERS